MSEIFGLANALAVKDKRIAELEQQLGRMTAERDDWEGRYNALYTNGPLHTARQQLAELREAHKRNLRQRTEYAEIGHRCSWRSAYEAVVQRSKAALQEQGE